MDAAKLDRRIGIYTRVPTQNSYGEMTYVDSLLATVSAQVVPIGGKETFMASQVVPQAQFKIVIRYRADISVLNKVMFESKMYDVAYVMEIGRREGLELLVVTP
jgi:SPP1 family predicted phage head-tail adaptor